MLHGLHWLHCPRAAPDYNTWIMQLWSYRIYSEMTQLSDPQDLALGELEKNVSLHASMNLNYSFIHSFLRSFIQSISTMPFCS